MTDLTKQRKDINDVTIQGVIVHKFSTDKVTILTVNTGNATPVPNYPKIVFFGDLHNEVAEKYDVKDHVCVKGNIQSSKRKKDVKNQVMQSVFGESIEKTQSLMENAFSIADVQDSYRPSKNDFRIAGRVVAIQPLAGNVTRVTLRVQKDGHISFARLIYFDKNEKMINEIKVGNFLCAVGCVQTSKKNSENGTTHYEDFVILEYSKI